MNPSRRRFVRGAVCLGAASFARAAHPQLRPTINVRQVGANGDGKTSDLQSLRHVMELAAAQRRGATIFFPPGEYFLGEANNTYLLGATNLRNVTFVGERATLSCKSTNGQSSMLVLAGCRDVNVEGLSFRDDGLKREINWLGAAGIRLTNEGDSGCENIGIRGCSFNSVLSAVVSRTFSAAARTRGVSLEDLSVSGSYYGFSWQDSGDDVLGRRLRCVDVKRSYFPFGVVNHDFELETSNNATGFTDVLIKCYHKDTVGIRAKVKCRGKRGGDAIVALDHQHESGRGTMRDIAIDLDVEDADCRLDTVVMIRSFDPNARVERRTTNRWDQIALDGHVRICDGTKLIEVASEGTVPGRLLIGPRLARHPRLPDKFPGFLVASK
jgi:hypothetical protein